MIQVTNESSTLANRLRPVLLRIARELRREIHSLGVTGGQVSLLIQIKKHPGITASQLAERERISAPGMSGHVARLETAGLTVTEAGERVLVNVRKRRTAWLVEHLKELTADERETLEAALPALERLIEPRDR
jgi:DNA-binding MarR family transcriptional regulator